MKMRNILSNKKTRKRLSCRSVCVVGGNNTNNLHTVCFVFVKDRPTADTVDRNSVDKVGVSGLLSGTDISGKEAQCILLNVGVTHPTDFRTDSERITEGVKRYGDFREINRTSEEDYHRRISAPINVYHPLVGL